MDSVIIVHPRIGKRHGLAEGDVLHAWENAFASRRRSPENPDQIVAVGPDTEGRLLEMVGIEGQDGGILVFHAMELRGKVRRELGL